MANIWKPRPPSFPSDDKIPFTAAEVNEFDDIQDLNVKGDNERKASEAEIDLNSMQTSKLMRARDSVYIRRKQRDSIASTFEETDEDSYSISESHSTRNVKFRPKSREEDKESVENEVFEPNEEEVVYRRKTINSNTSMEKLGEDSERNDETKAWDVFKTIPPPDEDETLDGVWVEFFVKCLKIVAYFITFVVTLFCAVASKSLILLMTSMIRVNRMIPICNDHIFQIEKKIDLEKSYNAVYREDDPQRIAWIWCLFFAVIAPEIFAFGRSFRICYFKKYKIPEMNTFITVFTLESLHSIGLSLLVFFVLPSFDAIKGSMLTNSVCLIPGLFLLLKQNQSKVKHLDRKPVITKANDNQLMTSVATICQLLALICWPIIAYFDDNHQFWCIPFCLFLISLSWWENFISYSSTNRFISGLMATKKDLTESRYFTFAIISIWKIIVVFSTMVAIIYLNDGSTALKTTFTNFTDAFSLDTIKIIRDFKHLDSSDDETHLMTIEDPLLPIWILLIQISATYLCYAFAKFSCKIHIQTISFAIPVHLVVPVTNSFIWVMVELSAQDNCKLSNFFNGFQYIFWFTEDKTAFEYYDNWSNYVLTLIWILSLASQIMITIHIWKATSARLAPTEELFVNPMYNSVLIDQSLALNRRRFNLREEQRQEDEESLKKGDDDSGDSGNYYETLRDSPIPESLKQEELDDTVRIFVCATMWHENKEEMIQMLKACMRLDEDQFNRRAAQELFKLSPEITDYYEIEFNIYFDDAFDQGDPNIEDDRKINRFVRQLIETMDDAASNVHGTIVKLKEPNLVPTPYGGKLEWTLPGQNKLVAHLKDKLLIRHRKRWSQCMYMYYLLGHRIAELPIDDNRKERISKNTFILALDGDINFRPQALALVVDLMKKNKNLGAACGRIHPIGTGPMVWYQKFEYAIGHWLQKATEHVFGCVLCSPGCFSLFRARAVMDDSVMNKYTTKPSEALHYVQYDQGEDRWLCTLLLQQGWRIEYCAASDSYTHAPEGFGEFYTQRRRWAPSTMANIMDLLGDYKRTVDRNTDISKPYIAYQAMLMLGTILSPGTIFLMVVGAMNTVMNIDSKYSLLANIVPILLFAIICLTAKKNDHIIFVAMILSTIYALLMLAVLVGTAIDIKDKGPWTPNSIFFMGMMASFIIAAILHPQEFACVLPLLLYMLLIPSMYLLLTIYSVTNMHVVSWGTREVKATLTAKEMAAQEEAAKAAEEAKKNKKGRFGFLNLSHYGSKSGIFTCMCCSNAKADEDTANLLEIKDKINRVYENIDNMKNSYDQKGGHRGSIYRRKSFTNRDSIHLSVTEEEDEDDMESVSETTSLLQDQGYQQKAKLSIDDSFGASNRPKWTRDPIFNTFPYEELNENELNFWNDFIPKYLLPLDENPTEQKRISDDLKELRNRAVFAFGIINVVFILFVYLLQMHKDVFGIPIVSGIKEYNKTYNEEFDRFENIPIYEHVIMDPIGLVLIVFFGAILIVQMIGMFMHRFGTLAQLLSVTSIDFFDTKTEKIGKLSEENLNRQAVRITRRLQKEGVRDMTETDNKTQNPLNRRQSVFQKPQTATQHLDLTDVFRSRIMSIKPEEEINVQGLRRKSIGQALINRRQTVDWGKVQVGSGNGILRLNSKLSSQLSTQTSSRTPSMSSYNPRPKSITFQMPELMAVKRPSIPTSKQSPNESKLILNSFGTQPKVILTPETPVNEGPPTGQHSIAFFNLKQQNMANDMSSNIIRNSLNEVIRTDPKPKEEQISNEYQLPQSSSTQGSPQQATDQHNSDQSESNSTVSSNIDFNFDAYVESDSSGDEFPMTALQPTTVEIPTKASAAGLSLNIPTDRISFSEDSEDGVTRL